MNTQIWVLIIVHILLIHVVVRHPASSLENADDSNSFIGMANDAGLKADEYEVITEDGYILPVFHVKGNGTSPILLLHGFFGTADNYVLRRNTSLVKVLVQAGYDVYIGNFRGNRYSRKHVSKDPDKDTDYWDFGFHEMGLYDLPSTIDSILEKYERQSLNVIAYSQALQMVLVMGIEKPEYKDKVNLVIVMAPVCFLQRTITNPVFHFFVNSVPSLALVYGALGIHEFGAQNGVWWNLKKMLGTIPESSFRKSMEQFQGYVSEQSLDKEFLETQLFRTFPSSTSLKNGLHLEQIYNSKKFRYYDYGYAQNIIRYNSPDPPDYNVSSVTIDMVFLRGAHDLISNEEEVNMITSVLPNVKDVKVLNCSHVEFLWGKYANKIIYNHILQTLITG